MKTTFSFQQLKGLLFVQSLFALVLAAPGIADAIDIKDTDYPVPSGAYFVSPNGKAGNSGKSPDEPWSAEKALKSAPDGATIVFKGGTYRNVSAKINKKLTLQAYPHSKPWLKGSVIVKGWVREGNKWRKDGWNYSFPLKLSSSKYLDRKYPMARYGDMVYVNGVSLKQVANSSAVKPGTFYVDSANNRLYIGNNPEGKTVEATALKDGLLINSLDTVVRGLGFSHYAESGIKVQADHVTVENNTSVWNGVQGAGFVGADAIVRGNTFSYNGRKGVGGYLAHRMLLENNTISYNNVERFSQVWDAGGIKVVTSNGVIWRNNIVKHNFANGMWIDVSSTNATVIKNTSYLNEGMGIFFELSHNAIIAANVAHHNLVGIMVADSSNARVYNNTLSMNFKPIVFKDSPRKNTKYAEITRGITWITRNNVRENNLFSLGKNKLLFVDEASGDYRLKPNSPAIGRGSPLPADIARAIGVPAGVRVDLGAIQSKVILISN